MNSLVKVGKKTINTVRNILESKEVDKIYQRPSIYHFHVRKTAGSSINLAFFDNYVNEDVEEFYQKLAKKYNGRLIRNNAIIVGWNKELISEGKFNYAFSHLPLHQLHLPAHVFKFTCLRNPVNRVVSHYNMLMYYWKKDPNHPAFRGEGVWFRDSFDEFLQNIPTKHLKNQLYMFSEKLDSSEAFDNVMNLAHIMFTEDFESALEALEAKLNLNLPVLKIKEYGLKSNLLDDSLCKLMGMLNDEYKLLDKLKFSLK